MTASEDEAATEEDEGMAGSVEEGDAAMASEVEEDTGTLSDEDDEADWVD